MHLWAYLEINEVFCCICSAQLNFSRNKSMHSVSFHTQCPAVCVVYMHFKAGCVLIPCLLLLPNSASSSGPSAWASELHLHRGTLATLPRICGYPGLPAVLPRGGPSRAAHHPALGSELHLHHQWPWWEMAMHSCCHLVHSHLDVEWPMVFTQLALNLHFFTFCPDQYGWPLLPNQQPLSSLAAL